MFPTKLDITFIIQWFLLYICFWKHKPNTNERRYEISKGRFGKRKGREIHFVEGGKMAFPPT